MKAFREQKLRGMNEYGKESRRTVNLEMEEVLPTVMGNEIDLIIGEEVKLITSSVVPVLSTETKIIPVPAVFIPVPVLELKQYLCFP